MFCWEFSMETTPHRGLKEGSRWLGCGEVVVASACQWAVAMMVSVIFFASSREVEKTNTRA